MTFTKWIKLKSKKMGVITLVAVVVLSCVVWAYTTKAKSTKVKVDELSDRAREFVEQEKKKSSSEWKWSEVDATASTRLANIPKTLTSKCFTFHAPFVTRNEHVTDTDAHCVIEARIDSPPARLVVGVQPLKGNLDDDAGILMRKKFPKQYVLENVVFEGWPESRVYREKEGVIVFLHKDNRIVTVATTEMTDTKRADENFLQQLISGIELK